MITETELKILLNDKLCDMADALLEFYDCCGIKGSNCKAGKNHCCTGRTQFGDGCPFWKGGCRFRNCDCKLWICETAIKTTDKKCVDALLMLERFGQMFGIVRDKPVIGEPYSGGDKQPNEK